jgi:hypothetical protein
VDSAALLEETGGDMGGIVSDVFGKSQPQAPAAPDPYAVAGAQGAANKEAALTYGKIANPNINSPLGTQRVTWEGDTPTITQALTPTATDTIAAQQRVQKLLAGLGETGATTAQGVIQNAFTPTGAAANPLQTSINTSNLAQMPVNAGTTGQEAIMARLAPQLERRQASVENQLANQGITPGSEAYRTAQTQEAQNRNDLLSQAALQGINLDTGARAQGFNEATSTMATQNAAQQQELARQLAARAQPLNEITGLMSGSQIQMPQFQQYQSQQVAPAPIASSIQNAANFNQGLYGQQMNAYNTNVAGIYDLLGSGASAGVKKWG